MNKTMRIQQGNPGHGLPARQKGATLVIALLVLVLIMMIGITAISTSNTQYKLAGNLQFEDSAMNNAEKAINAAENWLITARNYADAGFTVADPAKPQLMPFVTPRPATRDAELMAQDWQPIIDALTVGGKPVPQPYVIELLSKGNRLPGSDLGAGGRASAGCNQVNTYLITGRGLSARGATKFVQSYFSKLSCS